MSNLELGAVLFALMMALIILRMPIAISMFVCGALGFGMIAGWRPLIGLMAEVPYSRVANHELTVIPLFVLMGQLASQGGISQGLYRSARAWVGHFRGGIAMATIGGCADVRCHLRLLGRDRSDNGVYRLTRDATLRLFGRALDQLRWPPAARSVS